MEKIAVHCKTSELFVKVTEKAFNETGCSVIKRFHWNGHGTNTCIRVNTNTYASKSWYVDGGCTIISAEEYLKGGGDVEFKVGDRVRLSHNSNDYHQCGGHDGTIVPRDTTPDWRGVKWDNGHVNGYPKKYLILISTSTTIKAKKNKTTKKENEMKRVRVLLINRADDAVIYDHEVKTELSDADLKVQVMLEKAGDIKKACKDVTLLHWEIKTITSYDKPEVK